MLDVNAVVECQTELPSGIHHLVVAERHSFGMRELVAALVTPAYRNLGASAHFEVPCRRAIAEVVNVAG